MKIFRFVKKVFFTGLTILSGFTNANSLSCISMNNEACKARPEIINVNSNNPVFYPFSNKTSKCSSNCNNINDPYAELCVPDIVKDLNVKVFNLMPRTNETRHIKWYETCKCICRLDAIVCNNKQHWNKDKCRCECKESVDKGVCDKGYACNPSNCECECDMSCDIGKYLDYENCQCRKRLLDKFVDDCDENIDEVKIVSESKNKFNSCILYIVLFSIFFTINVGIGGYFVYYKYMNRNKKNVSKYYDYVYQTKNY